MEHELEDKGAFEKGDQAKHHPIITNVEMNKEKTMNVRDDDIVRRQRIGRRGTKQEEVCCLSVTMGLLATTTKRTSLRFQVLFSDP